MGNRRIAPTSPSQRRLWFLDQFTPNSATYTIAFSLRLYGSLNVDALKRSIDAVVVRHAILRTTFAAEDGRPIQVIADALSIPLARVDLRHLPDGERREQAAQITVADARQPFDLETGPLLRTTLLQLGAQEHHLLVTIHHIISDEWSLDILCHDLGSLYTAYTSDTTAALSDLAVQYADYGAPRTASSSRAALQTA